MLVGEVLDEPGPHLFSPDRIELSGASFEQSTIVIIRFIINACRHTKQDLLLQHDCHLAPECISYGYADPSFGP